MVTGMAPAHARPAPRPAGGDHDASASERAARQALAGSSRWDVRWVAEVGSTNADLLDAAAGGAPDGTVLVADHQTAGRGRRGRSWQAPPRSSLLVSVLLRPSVAPEQAFAVTAAAAVAAVEACVEVAGFEPRIKWPNDLVVGEEPLRKLAGVLTETVVAAGLVEVAVVGMGLNVGSAPEEADIPEGGMPAVAAEEVAGSAVDRVGLLVAYLRALDRWYGHGDAATERLTRRHRELSATLGSPVRVETPAETFTGLAVDLTDDGRLLVEVDGERRAVVAADVVHLR